MTVGRRLILSLGTLVLCVAAVAGVGVYGIGSLDTRYRAAEERYGDLRSLYEIGSHVAAIRTLLNAGGADEQSVRRHLAAAAEQAGKLAAPHGAAGRTMPSAEIAAIAGGMRTRLDRIATDPDARTLAPDVSGWLNQIAALSKSAQGGILDNRREATAALRRALTTAAVGSGVALIVGISAGVAAYRSILRPLTSLETAAARMSKAHFGGRIEEEGDREFRRLIRHINHMSDAIDRLHRSLRGEVESQSRQLLRSEQLASVGVLAAGLAHEINNPLAIIAGHAQTSLRERAATPGEREAALLKTRATLRIICEEAFRCRDITRRLLTLAQPVTEPPEIVELVPLLRRAIELVRHLPIVNGRTIRCEWSESADSLCCAGHASQLLQVAINLLTNALEACPAEGGLVVVALRHDADRAVLSIADNGCGMDAHTLAHAFEPFFTDKPRRGLTGCGLGLSVSHAIAGRHAGRLLAASEGPGRGSTFTLELPPAGEGPVRGPSARELSDAAP